MCLTGHILILEVDLKELPYDPQSETIEDLQLAGLSLIQKKKAFRYGMDSVLLADFADIRPDDVVCDFIYHVNGPRENIEDYILIIKLKTVYQFFISICLDSKKVS